MISRAACLIVIPGMLYLLQFYILFAVARKTGPHDDMMSSAFQASLEVELIESAGLFGLFGFNYTLMSPH